jgi:folate-binding protein YgfZ
VSDGATAETFLSEYEAIRSRAGLVADATGLVWVVGDDAVEFLDGLVSQNVAALSPGTAARSLLLAPNGKLRANLWLLRDNDRVGLVCDAGRADAVMADLARFKIRVDVTITADSRPVWEVWGPDADSLAATASSDWSDDGATLLANLPFRHSDLPRLIVAGEQPAVRQVSAEVAAAVRIELGEPVVGIDLADGTIPQESGDVAAAVDFTKGCYLGQELVARIDSRGHVNRRLVGLVFAGDELPKPGTEVIHGDAMVGTITSSAWSGALQVPVGLGMLRVEVADDAPITVSGIPGRVSPLPIQA